MPDEVQTVKDLMEADVWSEYKRFSREDWQEEVANGDTNLGYWEYVFNQIDIWGDADSTLSRLAFGEGL
jgi:hypothetical protein